MEHSKLYYSESLLSSYFDSGDSLPQDTAMKNSSSAQQGEAHSSHLPSFHLEPPTLTLTSIPSPASPLLGVNSSRSSIHSAASSYNSLYSSLQLSDDADLQSIQLPHSTHKTSKSLKLDRLRHLFKGGPQELAEDDENAMFMKYVYSKLENEYFAVHAGSVLNVLWPEVAEIFLFGDTITALFPSNMQLLSFLLNSSYELGEERFSNLALFHNEDVHDLFALLKSLLPHLNSFNSVLDLYAESGSNIQLPRLFELFSRYANSAEGLCLPLAISMFGNWLLDYNRDTAVESNYENSLILNYFRKAARTALVLRRLVPWFESAVSKFSSQDQISLNRYLKRDTENALSLALYSLGQYHQFMHQYTVAVSLWEINCHLTLDLESGNLAILGLTDGFGFGNRIKERNKLGKRSKTNKFNAKRRIAHLYRILMKRPDFHEYGASWATKDKYD